MMQLGGQIGSATTVAAAAAGGVVVRVGVVRVGDVDMRRHIRQIIQISLFFFFLLHSWA